MNNLQEAVDLMKNYFYKIIKVDISSGNFIEIKLSGVEDSEEKENYSKWVEGFISEKYVHPKDMERFAIFSSIDYIREHRGKVKDYYRKLVYGEWRWVCFETEPCIANDHVMIYIRDVNDSRVSGLLMLETLKEEQDRDEETGIFNYAKLVRVIDDFDRSNANSVGLVNVKILNDSLCDAVNLAQILIYSFGKDNCFRVDDYNFMVILPNVTTSFFSSQMVKFAKKLKQEYSSDLAKYNAMWSDTKDKENPLSDFLDNVRKFL